MEAFNYEEGVDGSDHSKYLWGNAAYALGARLTNAFSRYGWCAAIRGVEGGGLVEGLPTHAFRTEDGDVALKCPTEIAITDRREKELADLGFVPLVHCKGTDYAAFFSVQTCQKPRIYKIEECQRQRAALDAVAVHLGGVPFCALSEVDDARQDRQLHVAQGVRDFPEPLDLKLCDRGRSGGPLGQGAVPAARGADRSDRG